MYVISFYSNYVNDFIQFLLCFSIQLNHKTISMVIKKKQAECIENFSLIQKIL